jgi:hypothetical protein
LEEIYKTNMEKVAQED